ncbi:MAG: hypothetical protein IPP35_02215 [Elusimicrobia bacterium]|nr:hypothetical protein [Elusimicrobiota bacterium]
MKKTGILLAATVWMVGVGLRAEMDHEGMGMDPSSHKAEMIDGRVDQMAKALSLTADQKAKVKAVLESDWEAKLAQMKEMGEKMKAMKEASDAKIKALLNPDQQAKFDKMCAEKPCCGMAGMKGHKCPVGKDKPKACCPMTGATKNGSK